ncbi:hypothetical protein [Kribbella catacumbae]|uniref:hypothetical protein n=1 Tax=Kribbella catacumbae TaxID=460086 RepID=UPI0003A8D2BC|nr:hypothetical protein [Kribbella catacumbae]
MNRSDSYSRWPAGLVAVLLMLAGVATSTSVAAGGVTGEPTSTHAAGVGPIPAPPGPGPGS